MPSNANVVTHGAEATQALGRALGKIAERGDVALLTGDLGAGKTRFVKGLAEGLGVAEEITSPTFNILLVHAGRIPLYHADLYRLDHASQLEDIDWWGVIEGDGIAAVEWGDRFPEALPADALLLTFAIVDDDVREITARATGRRSEQLVAEWIASFDGAPGVELR